MEQILCRQQLPLKQQSAFVYQEIQQKSKKALEVPKRKFSKYVLNLEELLGSVNLLSLLFLMSSALFLNADLQIHATERAVDFTWNIEFFCFIEVLYHLF